MLTCLQRRIGDCYQLLSTTLYVTADDRYVLMSIVQIAFFNNIKQINEQIKFQFNYRDTFLPGPITLAQHHNTRHCRPAVTI